MTFDRGALRTYTLAFIFTLAPLLLPCKVSAELVQLTCFETTMSSPLFFNTGGTTSTAEYNRALQISVDTSQSAVTVSTNYGDQYTAGTFPLQITDSTFEWNSNVQYNNGYWHYILDRYTATLKAVNTAVPGGKVLQAQLNYRCEKLQKQF